MTEIINLGEPPAAFVEAVKARFEADVLPSLPPVGVEAWRAEAVRWDLAPDLDERRSTVTVSLITDDGVHPVAVFDGATVGVVVDDDGWHFES